MGSGQSVGNWQGYGTYSSIIVLLIAFVQRLAACKAPDIQLLASRSGKLQTAAGYTAIWNEYRANMPWEYQDTCWSLQSCELSYP
jgi:hypothetical protein